MGAILKSISKKSLSKSNKYPVNISKRNISKINSLLEKDNFAWVGASKEEYKANSIPSYKKHAFQ